MSADDDAKSLELLLGLLRRTHLSTAAALPGIVAEEAATIGARDVAVYLIDHELEALMPLPSDNNEPLSVAGTVAGRAYSTTSILRGPAEAPQDERLWVPLLDGTERMGVLGFSFEAGEGDPLVCERYAHLVAMLVVTKGAYSDIFHRGRRRPPMTIASQLLPSL